MSQPSMTSNRPYLIRALYEWLVDNGLTPYLLVDVPLPQVSVPNEYVEEGRIVLNINPHAVSNLELGNHWIRFSARFLAASAFLFFLFTKSFGDFMCPISRTIINIDNAVFGIDLIK